MKHRFSLAASAFLLTLALFAGPACAGLKVPFGPGEKLSYEIYWTFIKVGYAELEVMPDTEMNGVPARHFRAEARTTPAIDNFYKVRDCMEAWTDRDVTRSLRYRKDQNEGTYHKKVDLVFDWSVNRTFRYIRGELRHELKQPEHAFDPMSVLFNYRRQVLYKTMRYGVPVTDGKKSVIGESVVDGMETVETKAGTFRCWRVNLDVKHISGVFRKSPDAALVVWFSADERRIPVKVWSKVKVGHFTLELVRYTPPSGAGAEN
ncbi:DUF3108 domain-containing protein [Pseudodesulfovibrio tunisiensis]|uniref:DUF3108 domain-containing protein n=1 Tax=Pseudodesulfovibrio tunisiensis TaxID=463192 RepID=UPI001FB401F9|nr:DUF3108 domain-containing protein [Pseudodesulfovibrio tunisiensis]